MDKNKENQQLERRNPRQARSRYKVELMLEAAMQLLDEGDLTTLTTNAVAAKAGVSIGTLYQYFGDKQALLDAMVARELGAMGDKVVEAVRDAPPAMPGERIRRVVRVVVGAYGGRGRVHRLLLEHAHTRGSSGGLSPMYARLLALLTQEGLASPNLEIRTLTPAQAFVLTHAMAGVLRTLAASDAPPPLQEVEEALVQMILAYTAAI